MHPRILEQVPVVRNFVERAPERRPEARQLQLAQLFNAGRRRE